MMQCDHLRCGTLLPMLWRLERCPPSAEMHHWMTPWSHSWQVSKLKMHLDRGSSDPAAASIWSVVNIPFEIDLRRFMYPGHKQPSVYQLQAVIYHYGESTDGHYVAACRRQEDWFLFDDTVIISNVSNANAYVLLYGKKSAAVGLPWYRAAILRNSSVNADASPWCMYFHLFSRWFLHQALDRKAGSFLPNFDPVSLVCSCIASTCMFITLWRKIVYTSRNCKITNFQKVSALHLWVFGLWSELPQDAPTVSWMQ